MDHTVPIRLISPRDPDTTSQTVCITDPDAEHCLPCVTRFLTFFGYKTSRKQWRLTSGFYLIKYFVDATQISKVYKTMETYCTIVFT